MAVTGSKLVASLLYDRYPELYWTDLPEAVRKIICTRIYQAPLPLFILITSGEGGDWSRLQLPNSNATSDSTVVVATEYSSSIARPQVLRVSAKETEIAVDACTHLTFKLPSTIDVSIFTDQIVREGLQWQPFLWRCGLCVAQFTVVESSSLELIAAHLRLHVELRCCRSCKTILPNSALAVDAPDTRLHRCSSLVVPIPEDECGGGRAIPLENLQTTNEKDRRSDPLPAGKRPFNETNATSKLSCEICEIGFNSASQYSQHLKNVHSQKVFICPECETSFSTKGNMTTHFQRVHNQSDSITCPICSKRFSSRFNLDRHIRTAHTVPRNSFEDISSGSSTLVDHVPQGASVSPNKRGYMLFLDQHQGKPQHSSTRVVADVNLTQQQPMMQKKSAEQLNRDKT